MVISACYVDMSRRKCSLIDWMIKIYFVLSYDTNGWKLTGEARTVRKVGMPSEYAKTDERSPYLLSGRIQMAKNLC